MSETPVISLAAFEFPTLVATTRAREDLARWLGRKDRDLSVYRLQSPPIVVVVSIVGADVEAAGKRLRRAGGTYCEIPEPDARALVERTIQAGLQGVVGQQSYEVALPLRGMGQDPSAN